ncbi:hypothetical protein EDB89DRAFT_1914681 [Lactarius sanguifluus]|nr:hypothetical protein EDB89DRAFT_1914681 [Lactarius sanguifluus]
MVSGANGPRPKLANMGKHVLNLVSYNFMGLAGNEVIKVCAIEALRKHGVDSCVPPGFYGTIADLFSTEVSILYLLGFSTIPCMISTFAKHGDIIIADRGINVAIQIPEGLANFAFYSFLENVLLGVEKEHQKCRGPLTRRFIVTEGIFEKDGVKVDLPKLSTTPGGRTTTILTVDGLKQTVEVRWVPQSSLGREGRLGVRW